MLLLEKKMLLLEHGSAHWACIFSYPEVKQARPKACSSPRATRGVRNTRMQLPWSSQCSQEPVLTQESCNSALPINPTHADRKLDIPDDKVRTPFLSRWCAVGLKFRLVQVIHCAGPFQRSESTTVLDACISSGTPYIDVCDDVAHSELTKALHSKARAAGVPCITTAGAVLTVVFFSSCEQMLLRLHAAASIAVYLAAQ
jgi:hypothetical protein